MTGCGDRVEGFSSPRAQRHVRAYPTDRSTGQSCPTLRLFERTNRHTHDTTTHTHSQAVIQESISLAAYLAEAIPSRRLESVVLYTWQKASTHCHPPTHQSIGSLVTLTHTHTVACHNAIIITP